MTCNHLTDSECIATRRKSLSYIEGSPLAWDTRGCPNCRRGIAVERAEAGKREAEGLVCSVCETVWKEGLRDGMCHPCYSRRAGNACRECGAVITNKATLCRPCADKYRRAVPAVEERITGECRARRKVG